MSDPFSSPKRRLARANEHISALKAGWRAFAETKPYVRVVETDLDSGDQLHKVQLARQMPDALTAIAVESVEALRSALDLVGYAAAVAGGVPARKNPASRSPTMPQASKTMSSAAADARICLRISWRSFARSSLTKEAMTLFGL